jgi:hypothetical protein
LAFALAQTYGLPVVIQAFDHDFALTGGSCNSGRFGLAKSDFREVEKWIFLGHSLGGTAAIMDVWTESNEGTNYENIAGLVLLVFVL